MLADTLSLAGKVALVTGSGKENGIGASTFSATYVRETLHVSAHAYNYASWGIIGIAGPLQGTSVILFAEIAYPPMN